MHGALRIYFTVLIPYTAEGATEWHSRTPGETLSRGAFASEAEAREWADARLGGKPYAVKRRGGSDEQADMLSRAAGKR